ncbi:MAG: DUF4832 domain-containing protein [bacterium]|nr:DUF4832 domain-containing protein [bacterium]
MDKRIAAKIPYLIIVVLGAAITVLLFYIVPYHYRLNQTVYLDESDALFDNPLTGFAPPAENVSACEDTQLVFVRLTWAEWEPEKGVYDIEALEEKFHISRWKEEKKHAVLRFVCDIPGDTEHMDIPEWLYLETGDGTWYDTEYGQGYSPNYENPYFRNAHSEAIAALASYCNQDSFVSYVELGSLGHWGEWHINTGKNTAEMPDAEVCWDYVLDYSDQFHNVLFLMRRNFVMVSDAGLGVYNDMAGQEEATERWLGWIAEGGACETQGKALELVPLEKFWETAPVGGELTSGYDMEELVGKRIQTTLSLIERSHMTFLGPNCPVGSQAESYGAEMIRKRLGYRLYIPTLQTQFSFGESRLKVFLTWHNTGLAPMYWDWPVMMYVYDLEGNMIYWESLDMKLSELVPDAEIVTESSIPFTDEIRQGFQIGVGIMDPEEQEPLKLAMDVEEIEGIQILYTYERE